MRMYKCVHPTGEIVSATVTVLPVSQADVTSLCKKTSWSERRVQVWFRRRRNQDRPGLRKRFCEARCVCLVVYTVSVQHIRQGVSWLLFSVNSWRCVFYFFVFVYGVLALYDVSSFALFLNFIIDHVSITALVCNCVKTVNIGYYLRCSALMSYSGEL